ncbi:putative selenate reductase subunit YgfK [bacterium]|nr:putative selenate reductase subunit YgfK [bacterium]
MSDRMTPIAFGALMTRILGEYKQTGKVFSLDRRYRPDGQTLEIFGEKLETPFGPAAGPNTQLSQNIIASYYAGCRFFELKTVQTLDGEDLPVAKPCINAADECYNVEWSTELRVEDAFAEYVRAWWALKLLSAQFGWGDPDGFVFNMSVGYDYKGITSPKIDNFIEGLKDASEHPVWKECRQWALDHLDLLPGLNEEYVKNVNPHICRSITLSTLHGCPPQEIEKIASYLIDTKKLNTFVKCNPTLLGYDFARRTLDGMGYDYIQFDDNHFRTDLQWKDAVPMFTRLLKLAKENNVSFGLKLTNTFPVDIAHNELPGNEMYMSGRSLYPLTVELAKRISETFDGNMRISYSGGADFFNIAPLFEAGIWPITFATTVLKPGGYQRCTQMAEKLAKVGYTPFKCVKVGAVKELAVSARTNVHHLKAIKPLPSRKIEAKVPKFDCFIAPCSHGCPIEQDIPEYVRLVGLGKYAEALRVITARNPLPFITGTICPHTCQNKCTRNFYEDAVHIRQAKLTAAKQAVDEIAAEIKEKAAGKAAKGEKVAVVGGGPAGMAAAFMLSRQGCAVTLFEKTSRLGGIVSWVIPEFRIPECFIKRDIALLEATGCEIKLNAEAPALKDLKAQGFSKVVYAVGAYKPGTLRLEEGKAVNVIDFLREAKAGTFKAEGESVVIVGGGNTAMDAARAAKRLEGVKEVTLVYRRDRRNMPADEEELVMALEDGVKFAELLAPKSFKDGKLVCRRMVLGAPDASGRRAPVETEETVVIPCQTLIAAVGEKVDGSFFEAQGLKLNEKGAVCLDEHLEACGNPGVYVVGDAKAGPATVVKGIADALKVSEHIAGPYKYEIPAAASITIEEVSHKRGVLAPYSQAYLEKERCLSCNTVCENCVQVCPNRAYQAIEVEGIAKPVILHIDQMCNYCGNCTMFCPYSSDPYREKFSLFATETEFRGSELPGFYRVSPGKFLIRMTENGEIAAAVIGKDEIDVNIEKLLRTLEAKYAWLL